MKLNMIARDLKIRVAQGYDAAAVAGIYVDSWNLGFDGLMPKRRVDPELIARWGKDIIAPLPNRWWVAELTGTIVGVAGIGPRRDPVDPELGELDTIAVAPSIWVHGVGRALMSTAVTHLIRDGYREAVLWTLAGYERGRIFYERTGWFLDRGTRDEGRQVCYRHLL
ncbi:MAG: GNAT family N-acetyltransferase [Candidatus Binataceae bacterium]